MPFSLKHIFLILIPAIIISLLFVTPFMVSDEIYNGVIMAKEFCFFGLVALMLLYTAIQFIVKKGKLRIEFNIIDILLLAFYTWCFIRAIFTPYTPFWHNHKLQILTGMMVVYFFVKNSVKTSHLLSFNIHSCTLGHWLLSGIRKKTLGLQMITTDPQRANDNVMTPAGQLTAIVKRSSTDTQQVTNGHSFILSFLIFSFILSGFFQAIYGLLQLYSFYPSHHNLFKITGSFFNPAPYAMYLAVVFPVALGKTLYNEKNEGKENNKGKDYSFIFSLFNSFIQKYLPFATVIAILLVLPATMNRASWLGAVTGSLVALQYRYNWWGHVKQWLNTRTRKMIAISGALIFISGICISLFYLKAGSSNGRLFIWEVTLGKIAEKPLFGHGLGRFEAEYNNWQAEYFMKHPEEMDGPKGWVAGNTKYAFNEFLEIGSEVGVIGLLLFLALLVIIVINSHWWSLSRLKMTREAQTTTTVNVVNDNQMTTSDKRSSTGSHPMTFNEGNEIILHFFIPSFLISMTVSFPFYSLPTYIIFFLFTGVLSACEKQNTIEWGTNSITNVMMAVARVALIVLALIPLQKMPSYKKWRNATIMYGMRNYKEANNEYQKISPILKYEGLFWQQYGKSMQMAGQNQKAIEILEKAKLLTSDQVLLTTLGELFRQTKQYKLAESNFQFSRNMQPHKLYPKYLLAKLFSECGEKRKATAWANKVLNAKIKEESMAVDEIKQEMRKLILKVSKP